MISPRTDSISVFKPMSGCYKRILSSLFTLWYKFGGICHIFISFGIKLKNLEKFNLGTMRPNYLALSHVETFLSRSSCSTNKPCSTSFLDLMISFLCSGVKDITSVSVFDSRIVFKALRKDMSFISDIR